MFRINPNRNVWGISHAKTVMIVFLWAFNLSLLSVSWQAFKGTQFWNNSRHAWGICKETIWINYTHLPFRSSQFLTKILRNRWWCGFKHQQKVTQQVSDCLVVFENYTILKINVFLFYFSMHNLIIWNQFYFYSNYHKILIWISSAIWVKYRLLPPHVLSYAEICIK